jgi:hypothetical protein
MNEVFVFGVIREPVDYVISMYNAHTKPRFQARPGLYTGDMSFEQFMSVWVPGHLDQLKPQISRFTSADGKVATNLLITFDRLHEGLEIVAQRLNVPALTKLPHENESPRKISRADIAPEHIAWIENHMRADAEAIRLHGDRLRLPEAAEVGGEWASL